MRPFLWSLVITIVFLISFQGLINLSSQKKNVKQTLQVHKTLYLERGITNNQELHILQASLEWFDATNGDVIFDIQRLPAENIEPSKSILFLTVNPDFPEAMLYDHFNKKSTLGYFHDEGYIPYIGLIDSRIDSKNYTQVILHELGHALGLDHINGIEGIDTLMYHSLEFGNRHITVTDLKYFCMKYHCDAGKYHGFPEIQ
ncbi:MAG TPA: matrixin family metalloprotease [Candidatus Saccharimonadales bacterium]